MEDGSSTSSSTSVTPSGDGDQEGNSPWLAVLGELARLSGEVSGESALCDAVVNAIATHVGDGALVLRASGDRLTLASAGHSDGASHLRDAVESLRLATNDPWVARVFESREPLSLADLSSPPLNGHTPQPMQRYLATAGLTDVLSTRLLVGGEGFGILTLVRDRGGPGYTAKDARYLAIVASQTELLLGRTRASQDRRELSRERDVARALLDTVLETAPIGFAFQDTDHRFLRINERLAAVNGLSVEEHQGRTLQEVLPDLAPSLLPRLNHVLDTGEALIDLEVSDPLSENLPRRHWRTSHYPIRLPDGELIGIGAVVTEITEQRRVEDELRARLRQQEAVAELGQIAVQAREVGDALFDQASRIVAETLDVRFVAVLETLPDGTASQLRNGVGWWDDMVGNAIIPISHDTQSGTAILTNAPLIVENLPEEPRYHGAARLLANGIVSSINVVIAGRGRPWGVLSAHSTRRRRFTPDDIHFMQAIANILSATIERGLVERDRQQLLDSANEGIFGIDINGICTYINKAALDLLGYTAGECLGQNMHELTHYKRPDGSPYPMPECPIYQAMWTGQSMRLIDETLWRKDGSPLPALYSCSPVIEHGQVTGSVVTIVDLREQQRIEQALRESLERAEHLARAEQEAREAAEAAVAVREEFLSIASHELKTPLTTIKASAQLLDRRLRMPSVDLDRTLRNAALLQREIARLETLVDDLLNATHIQRGRLELRPEEVDLVEITRVAIARFEHAPERHQGHRIVLDAPRKVVGWLDPGRIDQVLTNLISNALKYSPDGGDVRIAITQLDEGNAIRGGTRMVQLLVSDQGIGISPEEQAQLFQPFARGTEIRQRIRGSGLGLYITARIVSQHGGTIRVESTLGEGSTFIVTLPVGGTGDG